MEDRYPQNDIVPIGLAVTLIAAITNFGYIRKCAVGYPLAQFYREEEVQYA